LSSLRAFHAVSRCLSIRAAAEELLVSPQAVGQQLRQLEPALGVPLIERDGRGIRLTDAARRLAQHVNAGFDELALGVRLVTGREERVRVNLNVSPYFVTNLLMPRLRALREAVPEAEILLTGAVELHETGLAQNDIAIQWNTPEQIGRGARLLLPDPKVICCTPDLARSIVTAQDLPRQNLLHLARRPDMWSVVLDHLGVHAPPPDHRGFSCDDAASMRLATLQGLGVGLLSVLDAQREIALGHLVAPLGEAALAHLPAALTAGFYLIAASSRLRAPCVKAVHAWLLAQDWAAALRPDGLPPDRKE
jgi:LysR family glycine cleavage system transcriptional activator